MLTVCVCVCVCARILHPIVIAFRCACVSVLCVRLQGTGIEAYRFRIPASVYQNSTTNPSNSVYYAGGPDGLLNITSCAYKARVRDAV